MLVTQLLDLFPKTRLYVFDSKFAGDFDTWPGRAMTEREAPPRPAANQRIQVWQPIHIVPDEVEKWLNGILEDPPALLFVDELVHLCYGKKHTSEAYSKILKVGRMLPIGVITCTQELVEIPRNALGQATHIARFRLLIPYEQNLMKRVMKCVQPIDEPIDEHGFYYSCTRSRGEPIYFSSAQKFLK